MTMHFVEIDNWLDSLHKNNQGTLFPTVLQDAMSLTSDELFQLKNNNPKLFEIYHRIRKANFYRQSCLRRS